jgi:hypothetical protein
MIVSFSRYLSNCMFFYRTNTGSIRFSVVGLVTLLLSATIPGTPAIASSDDYRLCAAEMVRLGIPLDAVENACSGTIYPKDLTICVFKINQDTNIAALDALNTCRQVRRPRDLASCVVDISNNSRNANSGEILDNCRRSLLPTRFADCVVGINRELDIPASSVMASCIDGRDKPRDFYPPIQLR